MKSTQIYILGIDHRGVKTLSELSVPISMGARDILLPVVCWLVMRDHDYRATELRTSMLGCHSESLMYIQFRKNSLFFWFPENLKW